MKAAVVLREANFVGSDLGYDKAAGTMRLALTRVDASTSRGLLGARRAAWLRTVLTVRHIKQYKQSLAGATDDVYVFDRAEVGRGGQELAIYFRPGDRAVMDVEQIDGTIEDAGKATAPSRKPVTTNPLAAQEKPAAARSAKQGGGRASARSGARGGRKGP